MQNVRCEFFLFNFSLCSFHCTIISYECALIHINLTFVVVASLCVHFTKKVDSHSSTYCLLNFTNFLLSLLTSIHNTRFPMENVRRKWLWLSSKLQSTFDSIIVVFFANEKISLNPIGIRLFFFANTFFSSVVNSPRNFNS